ncbi:copper amine oxidase N-terminal domain-containing protein [Paenibacillus sp. ACRRX]|uniref:stalk domain-containing protein n=1 Tax=unclassified Paenibacillus TaxID=185978 RepID=UPI001EF5CB3D|nr:MULTISPECIES: stalk domain-containing protein [unclassified Paenibacillus]MCG7407657.1 copper amine oxidase N-terminal domain-containing protein [Paenibacillus sp. ACRRX]MDK8180892.1 stalk domain-containing protein [Paenibacillus sp. UMB4589-SE434]
MKCRRIAALVLLGSIVGGSLATTIPTVAAESNTDKVHVELNGQAISDGGVMVDGRAYVSVRDLQEALQAFVYWDAANKRISIQKPNIHMLMFQDKATFGKVKTGKTAFSVLVQVDSLKTQVDAIKLTITDPNGKSSDIQQSDIDTKQDNFWFRSSDYKYDFKAKGEYTVNCYLRQKNGEFTLLSKKTIEAV